MGFQAVLCQPTVSFPFICCTVFTGVLRTAMMLDRETQQEYLLVATATDGGGLSCVTEVRIFLRDVNDNPPEFTGNFRDTLTVQEDARINTLLTRVTTVDRDTGQFRSAAHHFLKMVCSISQALWCYHWKQKEVYHLSTQSTRL